MCAPSGRGGSHALLLYWAIISRICGAPCCTEIVYRQVIMMIIHGHGCFPHAFQQTPRKLPFMHLELAGKKRYWQASTK